MSKDKSFCWAILPAAGIGSRMGSDIPKQYLEVAGATLLEYSLRAMLACEEIAGVVVALHPEDRRARRLSIFTDPRVYTTNGAEQRCGSVLAGVEYLESLAAAQDWVLVHDAARPCLQKEDTQRLIDTVKASGHGAILAEPIVDTVKQAGAGGLIERTLDRQHLWRAQTPQMFRLGELRDALVRALAQGLPITDEASAMELAGYPVQLVAASNENLKVTVPGDLTLAAWYLHGRDEAGLPQ